MQRLLEVGYARHCCRPAPNPPGGTICSGRRIPTPDQSFFVGGTDASTDSPATLIRATGTTTNPSFTVQTWGTDPTPPAPMPRETRCAPVDCQPPGDPTHR